MATINSLSLTYADLAKRYETEGNRQIADIIELMSVINPVIAEAMVMEGNLTTGHRTTARTGLPAPAWRQINQGVQPSKSTTRQVTEGVGMLESYSKIDVTLAKLSGNVSAFRMSEDSAFREGFAQEMANTLFYGDTNAEPESFLGLTPRYDDTSAETGANIIDGGGAGGQTDLTSIWLLTWGDAYMHMIYPRGSEGGFQMRDLGEDTVTDPDGGEYQAYRTHYKWDAGLVVKDWRYQVRIGNIDLSATQAGSVDILTLMTKAMGRVQKLGTGRQMFVMNRDIWTQITVLADSKANNNLTTQEIENGGMRLRYKGIPLIMDEAITNTETAPA